MPKFTRDQGSRPAFRPRLTPLEDRTTPAAITTTGTTADVVLDQSSGEVVTFTTTTTDVITVSSSTGVITVNGVSQSGAANLTGIRLVLVNDSTPNNGVDFATSTVAYLAAFTVTLDNAPQPVNFSGSSAFGANNLTVTTASHILATGTLTSTSGNITLSANMQATATSGTFFGIELIETTISSATGVVTLSGRGGNGGQGGQHGVYLHPSDSGPTVIGGTVIITGIGGASSGPANAGVRMERDSLVSSTGNGSVVVTGTGGGVGESGDSVGVLVSAGGVITAGGVGSVVVTGTGGPSGIFNTGVLVIDFGSRITSGGGSVDVTGRGGGGGAAIGVEVGDGGEITSGGGAVNVTGFGGVGAFGLTVSAGTVSSGGTAPVTLTADSVNVVTGVEIDSIIRAGSAGTGTATIRPVTVGTLINLGGADVFTGTPTLGLTDAELDQVAAGTLVLGRSTAGSLTVTAPITRPVATAVQVVSGGNIAFTGGGVNTGGGPLTVIPNTGFAPAVAGTDATASTVSFAGGSVLTLTVNGTTPDTQFTRLNVNGGLNLNGVGLALSGSYVPLPGDAFTIVSATSLTGTLTGLPNGAEVTFNGVVLNVFYTPTAVVLRVNRAPTGVSPGGPYTAAEGGGLTVTATATDPDEDPLTYTWDVNGDGTFGDEQFGTVSNGGRTVTFPTTGLMALGLNDGPRTVSTLAVRVSDGLANGTVTATGTLTISNVAPTITSLIVPESGRVRRPVNVSASATDPAGESDPLAFAWVVTRDGVTVAAGSGPTFTFTPTATGTYTVTVTVTDGDGGSTTSSGQVIVTGSVAESVVAGNAGKVRVVNPDGSTRGLEPFPGFLGDVTVASADLNGDGEPEVVVGAGDGGPAHVKVYDGATGAESASFYAYAPAFTGGVFVAATADGRIVTGAGAFGGPHVKVIDAARLGEVRADGQIADSALLASFYAYDPRFNGGVRVAAGDVNGDGVDDMVTGAGPGGGPHVKVFDGTTGAELASFYAFAPDFAGGVYVAVSADGRIAAGAGTWGGPHVRVFDPTGNVQREFFAYPETFVGGVRVAFADVDADVEDDVITAPGLGGGLPIQAIRLTNLTAVTSFDPFDPLDPLGVFVG